jgi:hypothetical protein
MSGQRGALDDAAEVALKLRRILEDACHDEDSASISENVELLFENADDLANRIDNLRRTLRS